MHVSDNAFESTVGAIYKITLRVGTVSRSPELPLDFDLTGPTPHRLPLTSLLTDIQRENVTKFSN